MALPTPAAHVCSPPALVATYHVQNSTPAVVPAWRTSVNLSKLTSNFSLHSTDLWRLLWGPRPRPSRCQVTE